MKGATKERWEDLCQQATVEQDPKKLMRLVDEINRLLAEKEQRLTQQRNPDSQQDSTAATGS